MSNTPPRLVTKYESIPPENPTFGDRIFAKLGFDIGKNKLVKVPNRTIDGKVKYSAIFKEILLGGKKDVGLEIILERHKPFESYFTDVPFRLNKGEDVRIYVEPSECANRALALEVFDAEGEIVFEYRACDEESGKQYFLFSASDFAQYC